MPGHHHPTTFQDSANGANIATGKLAGVYVAHGTFQWQQHDVLRMAGVFGISENSDEGAAHLARCIAVELGAGTPDSVPAFLEERLRLGHHDGLVYCDRSDWPTIEQVCMDSGHHPYWWIADPGASLDDAAQLRSVHRGDQPVAVQNGWFAGYDQSVIIRPCSPAMKFTPPHRFHATG